MLGAAGWFTYKAGQNSIIANQAGTIAEAVKKARAEEHAKQEKTDEINQTQLDNQTAINAQLTADIKRLHDRTNRRHLSEAGRQACQGSTGRELSREDSEFLAGEAARADGLRNALKACYLYTDNLTGRP